MKGFDLYLYLAANILSLYKKEDENLSKKHTYI